LANDATVKPIEVIDIVSSSSPGLAALSSLIAPVDKAQCQQDCSGDRQQ
jgi:hypothetical protein